MQLLQALCLMLICLVCGTAGLVHYKKVEKTDKGCKFNDAEFAVGEVTQDPNSCGVLACMNTNGDTLIHYCQIPVTFQYCAHDGVSTTTDFPECCWKCVQYVTC